MQFICALTYLQQLMWYCVSLDISYRINWVDWGKGKWNTEQRRATRKHTEAETRKRTSAGLTNEKEGRYATKGVSRHPRERSGRTTSRPTAQTVIFQIPQNPHIYIWWFLGWLIFDKVNKTPRMHFSLWMSCGAHKFGEFIGHILGDLERQHYPKWLCRQPFCT